VRDVPESFFQRVVVPVANRDDAAATTAALVPHAEDAEGSVVAVHVIEKAAGALDKASVEQREQAARDIFTVVTDDLADTPISLETEIRFGSDVAATIIDAAHEGDASAIVFTPRGGSRWQKLLTGDVTHGLVADSHLPILVLPDQELTEE
jgi:nucleotide-binding universal stress UspA family protein